MMTVSKKNRLYPVVHIITELLFKPDNSIIPTSYSSNSILNDLREPESPGYVCHLDFAKKESLAPEINPYKTHNKEWFKVQEIFYGSSYVYDSFEEEIKAVYGKAKKDNSLDKDINLKIIKYLFSCMIQYFLGHYTTSLKYLKNLKRLIYQLNSTHSQKALLAYYKVLSEFSVKLSKSQLLPYTDKILIIISSSRELPSENAEIENLLGLVSINTNIISRESSDFLSKDEILTFSNQFKQVFLFGHGINKEDSSTESYGFKLRLKENNEGLTADDFNKLTNVNVLGVFSCYNIIEFKNTKPATSYFIYFQSSNSFEFYEMFIKAYLKYLYKTSDIEEAIDNGKLAVFLRASFNDPITVIN